MDLMVKIVGFNVETDEPLHSWISVPIRINDVKEKYGIDANLEELEIVEHTFPFDIDDQIWVGELNALANKLKEFKEDEPRIKHLKAIANQWFGGNVYHALDEIRSVNYYRDASNYRELAGQLIKSFRGRTFIAEELRDFFDIGAYTTYLEKQDGYLFADGMGFVHRAKKKAD